LKTFQNHASRPNGIGPELKGIEPAVIVEHHEVGKGSTGIDADTHGNIVPFASDSEAPQYNGIFRPAQIHPLVSP
jgi:hypothetical protein